MKNIVITGSSKGLGFEMAKTFLKNDCRVTLSGHNALNLEVAAGMLSAYKENVQTCLCDVSKEEDIQDLWDKAKSRWGQVDIWINNAGIPQVTPHLWEIPAHELQTILNTNLLGAAMCCHAAIKGMLEQGSGQVYNMEGFGSNGMQRAGINWYGTTKRALTYFTTGLALELTQTSIKVGRLSPGMMVTDFITGHGVVSKAAKNIYNILGDKPNAPAAFLVNKMLGNNKNNAHFEWLTNAKVLKRFVVSIFWKRDLFAD